MERWWATFPALGQLVQATHNADHVKLSDPVRLSVQHLNEQLAALHQKGDAIEHVSNSWPLSSFGLRRPSRPQQQALFDLYREYNDLTYSTLSALASALNRLTKRVQGVPWNSNERFLAWLGAQAWVDVATIEVLMAARDFRTVYVHPGQWKPFDWQTRSDDSRATVMLLGTHPPLPPGAVAKSAEDWEFRAPDTRQVAWAFVMVCGYFFGALESFYEADHTRCKWEEQGLGSAPFIAAERKIAESLRDHYERIGDSDSASSERRTR